jgi:hypothetical protein
MIYVTRTSPTVCSDKMSCLILGVVFFASRYNHVHYHWQHPICTALRVSPLDLHWIVQARDEETVGRMTGPVPQPLVAPPPTAEGGMMG